MKLFLLKRRENPLITYDVVDSILIRTTSPQKARRLATFNHRDEGAEAWLDPELSSCEQVSVDGEEAVIIIDANNG